MEKSKRDFLNKDPNEETGADRSAVHKEEANRQKASGGGKQPNEQGVTQGQNGEQGNTVKPENKKPLGKPAH